MMHGHEKSDLVIVAMKPANKANKAPCGGVCGGGRSGVGGAAKGNTHQQSTCRAQNRVSVSKALERIRPLVPSHTRGRSRMRESRTYGSGRGACDETHVPTATAAQLHHAARRGGGRMAARGAGAAGRDAVIASKVDLEHFPLMLIHNLHVARNWRTLPGKPCEEASEFCARDLVSFARPLVATVL